jgi:hypothetical protein
MPRKKERCGYENLLRRGCVTGSICVCGGENSENGSLQMTRGMSQEAGSEFRMSVAT